MPRPDLRHLFTAHLRETIDDHPTDPGDDRGWLLRTGVVDLVAPFVTALPEDPGDLTQFAGLDGATAALLLERLSHDQLADRQNDAPTLGTLLDAAAAHPDQVELHGYLVGPGRPDERITAEGLFVYGIGDLLGSADAEADVRRFDRDATALLVWALAQHLGVDGALAPPNQVTEVVNAWRPNEACWSLWWD